MLRRPSLPPIHAQPPQPSTHTTQQHDQPPHRPAALAANRPPTRRSPRRPVPTQDAPQLPVDSNLSHASAVAARAARRQAARTKPIVNSRSRNRLDQSLNPPDASPSPNASLRICATDAYSTESCAIKRASTLIDSPRDFSPPVLRNVGSSPDTILASGSSLEAMSSDSVGQEVEQEGPSRQRRISVLYDMTLDCYYDPESRRYFSLT